MSVAAIVIDDFLSTSQWNEIQSNISSHLNSSYEESRNNIHAQINSWIEIKLKELGLWQDAWASEIKGFSSLNSLPKGIGLKLHNLVHESSNLTVAACFGGDLSLEVYKMNKFNIINNLNRYVIPLNNKNYKSVINSEYDSNLIDLWSKKIERC